MIKRIKSANLEWLVLATVMIGTFLGRLDQTIVNLALPKIIDDFSITVTAAGWIATAYIIANAIFVPIWGKLGDTIGRRKVYIMGFSLFIIGSVLAGLAWNLDSMIIFRIIQAIAGSADYPTAMAIIAVTFRDRKKKAQALGIWSASFAAASVFGPLVGGPLIDTFGWRSVFLINLPIGLIGIIMAMTFINESVSAKKTVKFDWWGASFLGISLSTLVLILDKGTDWGWTSTEAIICYLVTITSFIIFQKIEKNHPEPIIDFGFFKNAVFMHALFNNFIIFMGMMGSVFLVPIFSSIFLGYNSTQTGYLFMPMAASIMIAAPLGGRLVGKVQPKYILAFGTSLTAFGIYLFSFLDARSGPFAIMIPFAIFAFGIGFSMSQSTSMVASSVPVEEIGIASSILGLGRNIAGAFGIALFGTLLTNFTETNIVKLSQNSYINSHSPTEYKEFISLITLKAQILSYSQVFIWAACLIGVGAISAMFIKKINIQKPKEEVIILD